MLRLIFKKQCQFCIKKQDVISPQKPVIIQIDNKFTIKDFAEITKFKLSLANMLVALPLFVKYNPTNIYIIPFSLATQLMAMATQTANQAIEVDYDKLMVRTCRRPLPLKKIEKHMAVTISCSIWSAANILFYSCFNLNSMIVANTIFFSYVFIYTPMKRQTHLNTMFGAIVGALPVYLGHAAAGQSLLDLEPLCQFGYMFAWQFSHFYGILWTYRKDYNKAGFKMLQDPNVAVNQMKYTTMIAGLSCIGLGQFITNNHYYLTELIMIGSLYKWAWLPLQEFSKNPGVETAKNLKIKSYIHFMMFWIIVYGDIFYEKAKEIYQQFQQKQQEQQLQNQNNQIQNKNINQIALQGK